MKKSRRSLIIFSLIICITSIAQGDGGSFTSIFEGQQLVEKYYLRTMNPSHVLYTDYMYLVKNGIVEYDEDFSFLSIDKSVYPRVLAYIHDLRKGTVYTVGNKDAEFYFMGNEGFRDMETIEDLMYNISLIEEVK